MSNDVDEGRDILEPKRTRDVVLIFVMARMACGGSARPIDRYCARGHWDCSNISSNDDLV